MILELLAPRIEHTQIELDKCEISPYCKLRGSDLRADELIVLPDRSLIIVEKANSPKSTDVLQALKTLEQASQMRLGKVRAVVVIAKKSFRKNDFSFLVQSLRTGCSKYGAEPVMESMGELFKLQYRNTHLKFRVKDC